MSGKLVWDQAEGVGFHPAEGKIDDNGYFDAYKEYSWTEKGKKVNRARLDLVKKFVGDQTIVDVGIGSGFFIEERTNEGGRTFGYDINPKAIQWLLDRNLWQDPYQDPPRVAMTLWDTIECMRFPMNLLMHQVGGVFCSLPIFKDKEDVLSSGFMKPYEPYHFFTYKGFLRWMGKMGYQPVEVNNMEEKLGCERIMTFVFRKAQ